MKIIVTIAALLLAGCASLPPEGVLDRSGARVTACYPQDRDQCAAQPELPWCKNVCPE